MPEARNDYITFVSTAEGLDDETFLLASMDGVEGLNRPYRFEVELMSRNAEIDALSVLKSPATLGIKQGIVSSDGKKGLITITRTGMVASFDQVGRQNEWTTYRAVLVPPLWRLSLSYQSRIFQDLTVPELVAKVLTEAGIPSDRFEFKPASRKYPKKEYVVQYEESDLDFLHRWLEHEGIFYWFEQIDGDVITVFGDAPAHYTKLNEEISYTRMEQASEAESSESSFDWYDAGKIGHFLGRMSHIPKTVVLKDYNWRKPADPLEMECEVDPDGMGIHYEFNNHYKNQAEGSILAKIRAQEILCRRQRFQGQSTCRNFAAGSVFGLVDHYRPDYNAFYLLLEVRHKASQDVALATSAVWSSSYGNDFVAMVADPTNPYRPPRETDWPSIKGAMNATVDGAGDGTSAEMDTLGRYKVRLPLDRSDASGGEASRYMRMAQPNAGKNVGMQFPLYPGTEVLLTHVDGDPDRPIIAGALANVDTPSPVGAGNETDAVIQTSAGRIAMGGDPEHPQTVLQSDKSQIRFGSGSANFLYAQTDCFCENNSYMKNVLAGCDSDHSSYFANDTMVGFPLLQYGFQKFFEIFESGMSMWMDADADAQDAAIGDAKAAKIQEKQDEAHRKNRVTQQVYDGKVARKEDVVGSIPPKQAEVNAATDPNVKQQRQDELDDLNTDLTTLNTWLDNNHTDAMYWEALADAHDLSDDEVEDIEKGVKHSGMHIGFKAGISVWQGVHNMVKALTLFIMGKEIDNQIDYYVGSLLEPTKRMGYWSQSAHTARMEGALDNVLEGIEETIKTALEMIPFGTLVYTVARLSIETGIALAGKKPSTAEPGKTVDEVRRLGKEAFKVVRKSGRLHGATVVGQAHDGENISFQTEIGDIFGQAGRNVHFEAKEKWMLAGRTGVEISAPSNTIHLVQGKGMDIRAGDLPPNPGPPAPDPRPPDYERPRRLVHEKFSTLNMGKDENDNPILEMAIKDAPPDPAPPAPLPPSPPAPAGPPPPDLLGSFKLMSQGGLTGSTLGIAMLEAGKVYMRAGEDTPRPSFILMDNDHIQIKNDVSEIGVLAGTAPGAQMNSGEAKITVPKDGEISLFSAKGVTLAQKLTAPASFIKVTDSGDITIQGGKIELVGDIEFNGTFKEKGGTEITGITSDLSSKVSSSQTDIDKLTDALEKMRSEMETQSEGLEEAIKSALESREEAILNPKESKEKK